MTISTNTDLLFGALVKAQSEMGGAIKDATNPAFKSKYADLASVLDAAKGPMKNAGLALTIIPATDTTGQGVNLTAMLVHASGQFIQFDPFLVLVTKKDAQGQGSAITYGRRYLTMSILGIPAEDDDGNGASHPAPKAQPQKPSEPSRRDKATSAISVARKEDKITAEQFAELAKDLSHAGTTDALLDAVSAKFSAFLKANKEASSKALDGAAEAFEAQGFEVEQ
jgi:cellobiose-specific phosphotransferase system component IIA